MVDEQSRRVTVHCLSRSRYFPQIEACVSHEAVLSRLYLTMATAGLYQGEYKLFIEIHSAYESLNLAQLPIGDQSSWLT